MARPPRLKGDDIHYHIILRCNNQEHLLQSQEDFDQYLAMLQDIKKEFCMRLYNYELLHSHVHLLLSTHKSNFIDQIMHKLCLSYTKDFNKRHQRSGHLWAHRYRSHVIFDDRHGIACLRYQHRNTLSAGIVSHPEDWPWSGYSFYAFGSENRLLEPHPSFLELCGDEAKRRKVYRELVTTPIPADKAPKTMENGNGRWTRRLAMAVNQVNRLKAQLKATL